jgi:hypothetical protein
MPGPSPLGNVRVTRTNSASAGPSDRSGRNGTNLHPDTRPIWRSPLGGGGRRVRRRRRDAPRVLEDRGPVWSTCSTPLVPTSPAPGSPTPLVRPLWSAGPLGELRIGLDLAPPIATPRDPTRLRQAGSCSAPAADSGPHPRRSAGPPRGCLQPVHGCRLAPPTIPPSRSTPISPDPGGHGDDHVRRPRCVQ